LLVATGDVSVNTVAFGQIASGYLLPFFGNGFLHCHPSARGNFELTEIQFGKIGMIQQRIEQGVDPCISTKRDMTVIALITEGISRALVTNTFVHQYSSNDNTLTVKAKIWYMGSGHRCNFFSILKKGLAPGFHL